MEKVYVFNIASICTHGEELLRQLAFHQKNRRSQNETDVRHICEIGVRTRWDLWRENNWLGRLFMEILVFDWWWTSHHSPAHKSLRILRFIIVSWKMSENPQSNIAWEDRLTWFKVHKNTELWTELIVSQWNSSGTFSQDSPLCSSASKSKSCW